MILFVILMLFVNPSVYAWEKSPDNPILETVSPWAYMSLGDPSLIAIPGGGFVLVYTAAGFDSLHGVTLTRPGAAFSPDGFSWTMTSGPVMTNGFTGTWDSAAVETPAILFDGDSIVMLYSGEREHGGGQLAFGLASSHDGGSSFARVVPYPILERDTTRPEEYRSIDSPTVIRIADSLVMWYSAVAEDWYITVCRASSHDGLEWVRYPGNPVMDVGEPGSFDEFGVYAPCVRQSGDSLIMLYMGVMMCSTGYNFDSTFLGCASSHDLGKNWHKSFENPVLGPDGPGSWDEKGPKTPTFCLVGSQIIGFFWNTIDGSLGMFTHDLLDIFEADRIPARLAVSAHPNPFNSAVTIAIETPSLSPPQAEEIQQAEAVTVEIFDLSGRCIAELPDGGTVGESRRVSRNAANSDFPETGKREGTSPSPTTREFIWAPAEPLPSGVYLVSARVDGGASAAAVKRVVYLK